MGAFEEQGARSLPDAVADDDSEIADVIEMQQWVDMANRYYGGGE